LTGKLGHGDGQALRGGIEFTILGINDHGTPLFQEPHSPPVDIELQFLLFAQTLK
jgi:hypothetical protein